MTFNVLDSEGTGLGRQTGGVFLCIVRIGKPGDVGVSAESKDNYILIEFK